MTCRLFANPRVLDVVLVDGSTFVAVVDRDDVDDRPDDAPAQTLAHSDGVTIGPEATLDDAMARLEAHGTWRLVVVGSDGGHARGLAVPEREANWFLSLANRLSSVEWSRSRR